MPIKSQHVLFEQPAQLPVLTFASQIYHRNALNTQGQWATAVLCIDKRSGRVVYKEKQPFTVNLFEISGNPEKNSVDLVIQPQNGRQNTVRLTYTDQPWPAESVADQQESDEDPLDIPLKSKVLRHLWKSV